MARRLGYTDHAGTKGVERLMKHYFLIAKSVGGLTRYVCAAIEAKLFKKPMLRMPAMGILHKELGGFPIEGGRLTIPRADHFATHPIDLLRIFAVSQKHEVEIHPTAMTAMSHSLRLVDRLRDDPAANAQFLDMLTSTKGPELTLRRLSEVGILGRFLPDFGRVVAQMQYDMYHSYTVDEHTIFAIGILTRIEQGELQGRGADRQPGGEGSIIAARALSCRAAARYRQGPRRRSLCAGRRCRRKALPTPRARGGRNGAGRMAGALSPADEQHRVPARYR